MDGWIKIHRKLLEWEWFGNSMMVHLFVYFLLKANRVDKKWNGIEVKRGQLITGINSLNKDTGISVQSLRTCIKRLKSTGEITIKSTNKNSIITICNYDDYQLEETTTNKQINKQTNKQLTNNQQTTNNKQEYKEIKEYKKEYLSEILISDFPELNKTYLDISIAFQELFKNNLKEAGASTSKIEKAKGNWIDSIRMIIEIDKYSIEDLQQAYKFLQTNNFWKKNILSASKLREKMDKIKLELNSTKNEGRNRANFEDIDAIVAAGKALADARKE